MALLRMIVLSLMVGMVAAGFTWFGWGLVANIRAAAASRAAQRKAQPAAENAQEQEKERPDRSPAS